MYARIEHDSLGTHFDWKLQGVTPQLSDCFRWNVRRNPFTEPSVEGRGRSDRYLHFT